MGTPVRSLYTWVEVAHLIQSDVNSIDAIECNQHVVQVYSGVFTTTKLMQSLFDTLDSAAYVLKDVPHPVLDLIGLISWRVSTLVRSLWNHKAV